MRAHPSWQRSANNNKEPHIFSLFCHTFLTLTYACISGKIMNIVIMKLIIDNKLNYDNLV